MRQTFTKSEKKQRLVRRVSFMTALFLSALLSFVVYGAVLYDSSKDPVVAYSAMESYVSGQLASISAKIEDMDQRLAVVELTGGGGGGSSGGASMSSEGAKQLLARITDLETGLAEAKSENAALRAQLETAKTELSELISELQTNYDSLETEITSIKDSISSIKTDLSKVKTNVTTLQNNFKQISDISTKLETVTYKVNAMTSAGGDITVLKKDVAALQKSYADLLEEMGQLYKAVYVPYNATVFAKDADDSLVLVLRTGSAAAVSPYNEAGTAQGLNDLSDGNELYNGDTLTLFHNILIPRGGSDGRGVKVTSLEGAYLMIGGDYVIVENQAQ